MFVHVERFRLRPGVAIAEVRRGFDALAAMVETLPGVEFFVVTENLREPRDGWSMVLFSAFSDRDACNIYARHPELARIWADELGPVVAEREVVAQGEDDGRGPAGDGGWTRGA